MLLRVTRTSPSCNRNCSRTETRRELLRKQNHPKRKSKPSLHNNKTKKGKPKESNQNRGYVQSSDKRREMKREGRKGRKRKRKEKGGKKRRTGRRTPIEWSVSKKEPYVRWDKSWLRLGAFGVRRYCGTLSSYSIRVEPSTKLARSRWPANSPAVRQWKKAIERRAIRNGSRTRQLADTLAVSLTFVLWTCPTSLMLRSSIPIWTASSPQKTGNCRRLSSWPK